MERVNNLIFSRDYQLYLQENRSEETERIFCGHDFEHLLEVARLTYILLLEENSVFISREIAYAAGLLHDIGRWQEYRTGKDHAEAGAALASPILAAAGFSPDESLLIIRAIKEHRVKESGGEHRSPLSMALGKADSLSRLCFRCSAKDKCNKIDQQPHKERLTR
jgi:uncharacterized protein